MNLPMNLINPKRKEIPLTPALSRREREEQAEFEGIWLGRATSAAEVHGFKGSAYSEPADAYSGVMDARVEFAGWGALGCASRH
jgi:hypothetical protein